MYLELRVVIDVAQFSACVVVLRIYLSYNMKLKYDVVYTLHV